MSRGRHKTKSRTARNVARLTIAGMPVVVATSAMTLPAMAAGDLDPFDTIARCESGNQNIESHSTASSASGYYQITDGTWAANGGLEFAPRAILATKAQQRIVAQRIFDRAGSFRDWNASKACWDDQVASTPTAPDPEPAPQPKPAPTPEPAPQPAPEPVQPAPDDTPTEQIRVELGDTLSDLAAESNLGPWQPLYEENRDVIGDNPHLIFPGQVLDVPRGRHAAPEPPARPQIETQADVEPAPAPVDDDVVVQTDKPPVPQAAAPEPVVETPAPEPEPAPAAAPSSSAAQVAFDKASAQLGKAYVWGGAGPNAFDCSGLVQFAYKAAGINLPHSSAALAGVGVAVSRANLQVGDIVAYSGHVGLYAGDGMVLQAANPELGVVTKPIDWAGPVIATRRVS